MVSSSSNRFLREIRLVSNQISTSSHFSNNKLHLSKYYWPVIIPHILFEQFLRSSNIWFLVSSIFQIAITGESPVSQFTTVAPLAFLLLLALIRDSYADFKLKKQDSKINNSLYYYWNGSEFVQKKCEDIIVGDIVMVEQKQMVPADLLMLSFENEKQKGFIDMSTISGISALKELKVIEKSSKIVSNVDGKLTVNHKFNGKFQITEPSPDYNYFDGKVIITGIPGCVEVGVSNMAFKGSYILGSQTSIGLVVYCGDECKILLNSVASRKKSSQIEKRINVLIIHILIALSMIVSFSLIPYNVKYYEENKEIEFKNEKPNPIRPIITFALLYSYIVPISLFVSIDIVRSIQSHNIKREIPGCFILNDKINEDLGQIEYILADKTGTITEKQLSVASLIIYDKYLKAAMTRDMIFDDYEQIIPNSYTINEEEKLMSLKSLLKNTEKCKSTEQFIKCMCLSNSLVKSQNDFVGSYDEKALIGIAEFLEYKLSHVEKNSYTLEINGKAQQFNCIIIRPFESETKKSRVVVSDLSGEKGFLYIKGERSKIVENLNCSEEIKININNQVHEMNNEGYRTMVLAYKELSEKEVHKIKRKIQKIDQILLNTESNIEKMMKKLETNLEFLGITCIEEKIAKETKNAICSIKNAGIKLWMVSGDTYSNTVLAFKKSKIMPKGSEVVHLREIKDSYMCLKLLEEYISTNIFKERNRKRTMSSILDFTLVNIEGNQELSEENTRKINNQALFSKICGDDKLQKKSLDREYNVNSLNYVVCIDGESLTTALNNDYCRKMLLLLLVCSKSACFSALTPVDKGKIVKLLKKNLKFKPIIMSVGLGEGNISLIREADIGISLNQNLIESKSLLQHHSDVIVTSFKQLEPLVLKHGHWFYFRICRLILLSFYKNFLLTILLIGFFFKCDYSGTSLFNSSLLVGFNIFFTSFTVIYIGVFDKDIKGSQIAQNLQVYMVGIMGLYFNYKIFLKYVTYAVMQAGVFLFVFFYFHEEVVSNDGLTDDFDMFGSVIFIALVFTVQFQVILETSTYSVAYLFSHFTCIAFLIGFMFFASSNYVADGTLLGVRQKIAGGPLPFFNIFCSSTTCVVFTYVIFKFRELFNPGIIQKIKSVHDGALFFDRIKTYSKSLSSIYKDSLSWNSSNTKQKFEMKKYTMAFKQRYIEKEYKENFIEDQIFIFKGTVTILWLLLIMWSIIQMKNLNVTDEYTVTTYILASIFSIFVFLVYTNHFKRHFTLYIMAGFIIGIIVKFAIEVSFAYYSILASSLVPLLSYFLLNIGWFWMHFINLINLILTLVSILVTNNQTKSSSDGPIYAIFMILLVSITLISSIVSYYQELSKRKEFKLLNKTNTAIDRTQSTLSLLLPPFIKNRVNEGARFIAEPQEKVTILFCDIYNFEQICEENKPKLVCEFLDKLFQKFDGLCENIGVSKIETVGKTYMACAGLKESEAELTLQISGIHHARRVVELGLAIIQEVKNTRLLNGDKLEVKIGINTGTVVAGVVGYHKPQFSLVGDAVNTASRMCSSLESTNSIQISTNTYEHVKEFEEYSFTHLNIEIKGKGKMETYLVRYRDPDHDMSRNGSLILPNVQDIQIRQSQINPSIKTQLEQTLSKISSNTFRPVSYFQCKSLKVQSSIPFHLLSSSRKIISFTLIISLFTYCLILLNIGLYIQVRDDSSYYNLNIYIGLKGLVIISLFLILYYLNNLIIHWYYSPLIFVVSSIILAIDFIPFISNNMDLIIANYVGQEIMFISLIFSQTSGLRIQFLLLFFSFVFFPWVYLAYLDQTSIHLSNLALAGGFSLINCVSIILRERAYTISTYLKKLASAEIKKTDKLLLQMIPSTALSRLQNNISYTETLKDVTILFADIVGFTNWCSNRSSEDIITMLYRVFKRFDKKCIFHDVYKVCTIGDCYVVIGYVGKNERDPWLECMNVVKMGKSMIKIIKKQRAKHDCDLNMRIGIHTGDIIGGIIGSGVVRYDIWGVDVLLANKIESSGAPGMIHASKSTKLMLEELTGKAEMRPNMMKKYSVDLLEKYLENKKLDNNKAIAKYREAQENYEYNKLFLEFWQENLAKNTEKCKKKLKKTEINEWDILKYRKDKGEKLLKKIAKMENRKQIYESRIQMIAEMFEGGDELLKKNEYVFKYDKRVKVGAGKKKIKTYFIEQKSSKS